MREGVNTNSQNAPIPGNICAIVVTYHPDEGFPERIKRIVEQVDKVVIVDNHSSEPCLEMIKKTSTQFGAHLILNDKNLGIATALNRGIGCARELGYLWGLTLDQDTIPHPTMVQSLTSAYRESPFRDKVGVIGSNFQEGNTGKVLYDMRHEKKPWREVKIVITSGSLISIPIFESAGPFRDDFFIDLVDIEYCLRLRDRGYKVIVSTQPGMIHFHGNYKSRKFLWRTVAINGYPPPRIYYQTRNALLVVRQYFRKDIWWVFHRLRALATLFLKIIFFEEHKSIKVRYMCIGVYHALLMKRGKLDE